MTKPMQYVAAPRASAAMGAAGAIIGGALATARNYDRVQNKEMSREDAVKDVLKETGTTGLATATATAVVSALGFTGLFSLAGLVFVTAGTKRLADKMLEGNPCRQALPAAQPSEEPAAKPESKKPKSSSSK